MGSRKKTRWALWAAGLTLLVAFAVSPAIAQKSKKKLMTKPQVIELIKSDVPSTRVDELVRAYGIDFEMTTEVAMEFLDAGAREDLIKTLQEISPKPEPAPKPEAAPAQPSPAPPAPAVLVLETKPPGAEVYVDEERAGKTSPEGKLKISNLSLGEHRVRVSAPGHEDFSKSVELTAGQTNVVAVALAAAKPPAAEPQANPQATGRTPAGPGAVSPGNNPMDAYKAILAGMAGEEQGDPNVKRFYVTHEHGRGVLGYGGGMCYGWLLIGNDHVQFSSNDEDDAFDVPAAEIAELQIKSNHIRFRTKNKKYHLITQDMGMLGGDSQGPGAMRKAFESVGLKSQSK